MDKPIEIRPAQEADAAAIARVRVAAWRAAYRGLMPDAYLDQDDLIEREADFLRGRLQNLGERAWVAIAVIGTEVIGYCAYGRDDEQPEQGSVYDLYVHPDGWRRGTGRQLLDSATSRLAALGLCAATLFVFEANTAAQAFYRRAGWRADGLRRLYQGPAYLLPVLRYRIELG